MTVFSSFNNIVVDSLEHAATVIYGGPLHTAPHLHRAGVNIRSEVVFVPFID